MSPLPLIEEVPYIDPIDAYGAFAGFAHALLFDIGAQGRYGFIAPSPFSRLIARNGQLWRDDAPAAGDPFDALRHSLAPFHTETIDGLPPFQGGAAGLWGYDLNRRLETIAPAVEDRLGLPDMAVGLYDVIIAFDAEQRRCWLISTGFPHTDPDARRKRAAARLRGVATHLRRARPRDPLPRAPQGVRWQPAQERAAYEAQLARVIDYVWAGDIFQANLSQRFDARLPADTDPFSLYRRLRYLSPAPFGAYLPLGEATVLSNSPERFLRLNGDRLHSEPIKGTRPRGTTPLEDAGLAQALLHSQKDRAENVMIVDLMRNDFSKVCAPHSVEVRDLCRLESYANVHHLVSDIQGRLAPGCTAIDVLKACFPGGSITGAPKIRAMEIIAELEGEKRGPYCGAIGYIGFDGSMDTNIAIRTLTVRGAHAVLRSGGGIVADSDPAEEYDETLAKAARLFACVSGEGP